MANKRKATASKGKVIWNEELEEEYKNVMNIMQTRIRLSPYDPTKRLRLVIDGAKSVGTGLACHHWLYYSDPVQLLSDCKGLLDLMEKNLAEVGNKKLQKILETASNYHWETIHISEDDNKICDALSRLCTNICFDFHKYMIRSPRLLKMSKKHPSGTNSSRSRIHRC